MDYYKKRLFIAQVNEHDEIVGEVERWEAHEKGILHRGFTVALKYQDAYVCQLRKHPVFDGVIDLSASSHPLYEDGKLQDINEAIAMTLDREWGMAGNYSDPRFAGKVMYSSFDGTYTEHEICHFYVCDVTALPAVQTEFAYGFGVFTLKDLTALKKPFLKGVAPWVTEYLKSGSL